MDGSLMTRSLYIIKKNDSFMEEAFWAKFTGILRYCYCFLLLLDEGKIWKRVQGKTQYIHQSMMCLNIIVSK